MKDSGEAALIFSIFKQFWTLVLATISPFHVSWVLHRFQISWLKTKSGLTGLYKFLAFALLPHKPTEEKTLQV